MEQVQTLTALASAGVYALLLILLYARRTVRSRALRLLLGFLAGSATWQLAQVVDDGGPLQSVSDLLLLLVMLLLALSTAAYINWRPRYWPALVGAAAVVVIGGRFVLPAAAARFLPPGAWLLLALLLWGRTWREYRATRLPSHATRVRYWAVALLLVFLGAGLQLTAADRPLLLISGHLIGFLGAGALAGAVSSYRVPDFGTRALRLIAGVAVAAIAAAPAAALLLLAQNRAATQRPSLVFLLVFGLLVAVFLVYDPIRRFIGHLVYRVFVGAEYDTSRVVRSYSQAVAPSLDVGQLAQVIFRHMADLFGTDGGALLLVTRTADQLRIEPVPAGVRQLPPAQTFPAGARFAALLSLRRQPLLQYELDFNPEYQDLTMAERAWLTALSMELYVPVQDGRLLTGVIALRPKRSGQTYRPNELDLLQTLAGQTVVALQNAQLYGALGTQNEQIRLLNDDLRRRNERLALMDKAKADFIAIASHELRTPLTQVKGYADILDAMNEENMLTREQTRAIIGHVNRATTQLENLVSAMLDASQLDVDSMQITFMATRLETILRLAVDPLMAAMRERRIELIMEGVGAAPQLQGDFKRLVQALHAVVSNAVKYTPDGGAVTISAGLAAVADGEPPYLEIVVADTGIGIDAQYHELIFSKFFRVGDTQLHSSGSTKFLGAGPGLGLPIARGVIEAHGGRIWVESSGEDRQRYPGSVFHILLPLTPPQEEPPPPAVDTVPQAVAAAETQGLTGKRWSPPAATLQSAHAADNPWQRRGARHPDFAPDASGYCRDRLYLFSNGRRGQPERAAPGSRLRRRSQPPPAALRDVSRHPPRGRFPGRRRTLGA